MKMRLKADWQQLVMLNYEVEHTALIPYLPCGLQIDDFAGKTLMSLVGFVFSGLRFCGLTVPLHGQFEEVNLRFYVRRELSDETRRGVVFVQEIIPRRLITVAARTLYNENYITRPMQHDWKHCEQSGQLEQASYRWKQRDRWAEMAATVSGPFHDPAAGSEQEFISEHYYGYCRQRSGRTLEYQVDHPRWQVAEADSCLLSGCMQEQYGSTLAGFLRGTPHCAFVARGSPVAIAPGKLLG